MKRADPHLQDLVDALDDHLDQCGGPEKIQEAFDKLGPAADKAIDTEIEKCVNSFRYYAENWHTIRLPSGELGAMYPFRESQNMIDALIEERIAKTGKAKIVVAKARQIGLCLDPSTPVLTAELKWVPIESLNIGDELVAVDEGRTEQEFMDTVRERGRSWARRKRDGGNIPPRGTYHRVIVPERKMRTATVEAKFNTFVDAVRVTMEDGRVLVASPQHRWMAKVGRATAVAWRRTETLRVGDAIRSVTVPWDGADYWDGWMGGMLDGEGHVRSKGQGRNGCEACISQVRNGAHSRAEQYLKQRGYQYRIETDDREGGDSSKLGSKTVDKFVIGRMSEVFRLIGQCRPARFVEKRWWDGKSLPGRSIGEGWSRIARVETMPRQRMVDIQTSTHTFIANGFVSHNSEYSQARILWRTVFRPGSHNLVVAQDPGQTAYLMDKSRLAYDNMPWWMRPNKRYEQRGKLIEFDHKDAAIRQSNPGLKSVIFAEAANKVTGCAVGKSLRTVHASELSSWENERVLNEQIFPAMRLAKDLIAIMESTARGRDGFWFPLWQQTLEGKFNDWVPLFIPAYVMKEYSIPMNDIESEAFELTEEELGIKERILRENGDDIPDGHFAWRRDVMAEFNLAGEDPEKFMQEYPETWRESFQSSGMCAFDKRKLQLILNTTARRPEYVGEIELEGRKKPVVTLVQHDPHDEPPDTESVGARLRVWQSESQRGTEQIGPEEDALYYVGSDVAMGNGGDFSCAQVFKIGYGMVPDEQVAEWHGWISPTPYARVLAALGYWYNGAEIACELNEVGRITGTELWRILEYEKLYQWKHTDKIKNFLTDYLGWVTNSKNRDELIVKMREAITDGSLILHSADLIEEMFDFGNDGGGRFEAVTGHDDRVSAGMICRYCAHESDSGIESARPERTKANNKKQRMVPLAMTEFSPVHDRPQSQEGRLYREYSVPAEYTAMVGRAVSERRGLLPTENEEDGWRSL